jgi:hypothetical protein
MGRNRPSQKTSFRSLFGGTRKHNHVCFRCELTSREGFTCPQCGGVLEEGWDKWRVPAKGDVKGWSDYKVYVRGLRNDGIARDGEGSLAGWQVSRAKRLLQKWNN